MTEYSHEEKKVIGQPKIIYEGTNWGLVEAPHIYKENGYYYLLTAEGGTKFEHTSMIARSKNIDGPYEDHPENPLITSYPYPELEIQKAGHGSMVETQNCEWYFAHLMARPIRPEGAKLAETRGYAPLGRETSIQKIEWKNDWPFVVGGNRPSVEVEVPDLPEQKWESNYPVVDNFDSDTLNRQFQNLRIPFTEEIGSLTAREGHLRLYGKESFHSQFVQSLVARRWQSLDFVAETKVEFEPETIQQQAGMVCYYNTRNWTSVHVIWNEEHGKVIDVTNCDRLNTTRSMAGQEISVPEDAEAVYFKVNVDENNYQFTYSFDGENWEQIPLTFDSYKLSDDYIEQAVFFTGAFVGMSAIDLTGVGKTADFDYFKYQEN